MIDKKRLSWSRKGIIVALWVPLVFTMILALVAFQGQRAHDMDSRWVLHTVQVKDQIERLSSLLKDVEIGQRSYVLTGNPTYLELFQAASKAIPPQSRNLASLIVDNPRQVSAVANLQSLITNRLSVVVPSMMANNQAGLLSQDAIVEDGKNKVLTDAIRSQIDAMSAEEDRLLALRQAALTSQLGTQQKLMVGLVSLDAALIVGLTLLVQRTQKSRQAAKARFLESNVRSDEAEARNVATLLASEVRYRRLFETAQDGILILDAGTGQVMDANPFMKDLLGYSQEEFLGKKLWEIGPFKGEAASKITFAELREKDRLHYESLPLETKEGRRVEVEFISNIYLVDEVSLIQCNIRDITERQKAEARTEQANTRTDQANTRTDQANTRTDQANTRTEQAEARSVDAILASELRYRRLFETAQDGILILDASSGQVVDANPFMKDLLGYSQEEFLGRKLWEIGPFMGEAASKIAFAELQLKDRLRYEGLPLETKDGRRVEVEFVSNAYLVGDTRLIQCNIRDLTERNRSDARFRRLVDSNAQGVFFWNTRGEISGANDAFLNLVGYTREDLESGKLGWIAMTAPKHAEADRLALEKIAATGVCVPYEKEFIHKDGSLVWALIGAATFADDPTEGVCFVVDLTERKKLEHQFLRAQRMESIGTLAGGIAHDLNNILAPIVMSIDILKLMSKDPQAMNILETIEVSAKRGTAIVRQVLSFARGVEGDRVEVQPIHLLKDLENIIKDTFPKDIELQFTIPNDTWAILGDPTQVHQVLLNLCVNARDAMPAGGSLTIDVKNCVLDQSQIGMNSHAKPGPYLNINVTDSGTGMSSGTVDKIFEPFFTTKELHKGTGLGLSTVMAIVKSHEGIISVYSELGKGSTFKVYFPAIEMSSEARREQSEAATLPRGNGEQILIIDDEPSILTITSQTLQAFGYRTLTATDGAEGLALYAQHRHEIAAVITDMSMPIMDGAYTIRALIRINPTVKIIAASGLNTNDGVAKASGAGVKHFLSKPYTAGALLTVIRAILDQA